MATTEIGSKFTFVLNLRINNLKITSLFKAVLNQDVFMGFPPPPPPPIVIV